MKTLITTFILSLLCGAACIGQTLNGTFQGEIMDGSPFFLHLEAGSGTVKGFYKYPSDSLVVPLSGSIDSEGNITLAGGKKPYPVFSGKLQNRVVRGSFTPSEKAKPQDFYAVNFRGEYKNSHYDVFRLSLSEKGYLLEDCRDSSKRGLITTRIQDDGRIWLLCDSLNTLLYLNGDTLVADTLNSLPSFIRRDPYPGTEYGQEELVFTPYTGLWSSKSFAEFPEKAEDYNAAGTQFKLNGNYSVRLKQIPRSEYITGKWKSAHLQHKPYETITDIGEAIKKLGRRLKDIDVQEEDGGSYHEYEITFKGGAKMRLNADYDFIAYFPQLEILLFEGGHTIDQPYDLNDSNNTVGFAENFPYNVRIGNPFYHAVSPDKQLRINGFYDGQDSTLRFLEKWNPSKKKYEFIGYFGRDDIFWFGYSGGWFWVNNSKALFMNWGEEKYYYEIEVIAK